MVEFDGLDNYEGSKNGEVALISRKFKKMMKKKGKFQHVEAMPSKIILMMPKNQESSKFQRIKSQASFKNQDSRFK